MKQRERVAAVAAVALAAVAAAPAGAAVSSEAFVPFVTDFPRPPSRAAAEPAGGVDWSYVGSGAGAGAVVLLAGAGAVLARRARPLRG